MDQPRARYPVERRTAAWVKAVALSDDPCFGLKMAEQYIADSRIALQEISSLLGFSEASAFSRAARRWTGHSPSAVRDAAAQAPGDWRAESTSCPARASRAPLRAPRLPSMPSAERVQSLGGAGGAAIAAAQVIAITSVQQSLLHPDPYPAAERTDPCRPETVKPIARRFPTGALVERFDALGLGEDLRFRDPKIAGGALLVDDRLVHLCAFGLIAREGTDSDEWRDQVLTQETDRTMPDINARTDIGLHGFVYILRVTDIDLPVCKIGSTTKDPQVRCAEINRSSTGDFIWTVAHSVRVDDCRRLESLVHKSLSPMKQAGREFFNLGAESAYRALVSILDSQTGINGVSSVEPKSEQSGSSPNAQMPSKSVSYSPLHSGCADLFDTFASVLGVQVKPWGQAARPAFGVSDGNDGVQWNLAVEKATRRVRLGVNLEGKQYINWPIATFILSELSNPEIMSVINQLQRPQDVNLRFSRDAWQVTARPLIEEKYIGGAEPSFRELDAKRWERILDEALGCLNENVNFRGRARQTVTLKSELTTKPRERVMEVSPHLNVWSAVRLDGDLRQNIEREMTALRPVYDWVRRVSQS